MRKAVTRAIAIILSVSLLYNGSFTSYAQEGSVSGGDAQVTESVEVTTPEVTPGPEVTAEPEVTASPEVTAEPEVTLSPEMVAEPEVTPEPETSAEAEVTSELEVTVSGGDMMEQPMMMFAARPVQTPTYDVTIHFTDSDYKKLYTSIETTVTSDNMAIDYEAIQELYNQKNEEARPYTIGDVRYQTEEREKKSILNFNGTLSEDYLYDADDNGEEEITLYVVLTPFEDSEVEQPVIMYDYESSSWPLKGTINDPDNYPSGSANNKRLGTIEALGTYGGSIGGKQINKYNNGNITSGIIKELSGAEYENVVMADGYYEPGFFSAEEKIGKTIYPDYNLIFEQTGTAYELQSVWNGQSTPVTEKLVDEFFPLDSADNKSGHNYYFGMRYDFEFTIGEYVGDMNYEFKGDDDLWVFLDGKRIIDVGGIHDTLTGSADLWEVLKQKYNYSGTVADAEGREVFLETYPGEKTTEHTISVLYMERGAGKSTCVMKFAMPQFTQKPVVIVPTTNSFSFTKMSETEQPLTGAKFALYLGEEAKYEATSVDGVVSFTDVPFGTYIMKETAAPEGYRLSKDTWEVAVTKDGVTINGTVAEEVTIVNKAKLDLNTALSLNKTAALLNETDRTYTLTLDAKSLLSSTTTTTTTKSVDVVMVLDVSYSMGSGRNSNLAKLKEAACDLIDATGEGGRIAIVKFGGGAEVISGQNSFVDATESGKETLKSAVNNMSNWSGTYYLAALEKTLDVLKNRQGKNPCFVIFVSDGSPSDKGVTSGKGWNKVTKYYFGDTGYSSREEAILAGASQVKDYATMYAVGIGVDDDEEELLTKMATDSKYSSVDGSASNIGSVLAGIQQEEQSTSYASIEDATITDYIDNRFELVEVSGTGYETGTDENGMFVRWNAQEILPQANGGWSRQIIVKAKDSFLGGDAVPTNGGASGVEVDGETKNFPIPEVDVRLLDLSVQGGNTTIFIEDEITPLAYWTGEMEKTLKATYADSDATTADVTTAIDVLSEAKAAELFANGTCEVSYSYAGTEFGKLVYKAENLTKQGELGIHIAQAVGTPYETYQVTVSYEVTEKDARDVDLSNEKTATCSAQYIVNVIAGKITIVKNIETEDTDLSQGDPIFMFKITKDGDDYAYRTVRFSEENEGAKSVVLENLPRGEYKVTELGVIRYECTDGKDGKTVTIAPQNPDGSVTFKNEKINKKSFSDTDVVVNGCYFDADGKLVWSGNDLK